DAQERAMAECDFLLHGSAASLSARAHVVRWMEETGKPFGIYGITLAPQDSWKTAPTPEGEIQKTIEALNAARFVYFRDSESLRFAREKGCTAPVMEFAPDGAFACDLRDDARAAKFMAEHGLEAGAFLCCI